MSLRAGAVLGIVLAAAACADTYYADLEVVSRPPPPVAGVDSGSPVTVRGRTPPVACPNIVRAVAVDGGGAEVESVSPDAGATCGLAGAVCEYGASPDLDCNALYTCDDPKRPWQRSPWGRCIGDQCPGNAAVRDLEGVACGDDASAYDDEVLCTVSDGICACTTGRGGSDVHERRWTCTKPSPGCPVARPSIGQPCDGNSTCDYGSCRSKRGLTMACTSDVWTMIELDCGP